MTPVTPAVQMETNQENPGNRTQRSAYGLLRYTEKDCRVLWEWVWPTKKPYCCLKGAGVTFRPNHHGNKKWSVRVVAQGTREEEEDSQDHPASWKATFNEVTGSLRVGIQNAEPLSEDQMGLVYLFLVTIASKTSHSEEPSFLGFSHKPGWILVTHAGIKTA